MDTPRPPPDAWLKEREVLLALVNALNDQVNDLREQRDVWQHQAERLLLTMPTKPRRRWWQVFTRGVRSRLHTGAGATPICRVPEAFSLRQPCASPTPLRVVFSGMSRSARHLLGPELAQRKPRSSWREPGGSL